MSRCRAVPLAELSEFVHRELACESHGGIEHCAHMSRVEEETVASLPERILRIIHEVLRIEHVHKVSTAHSTARMP